MCLTSSGRTTRERFLAKTIDRALKTPGFMEQCQVAQATYLQQMAEAKAAVERLVPGGFTWAHRPDVPVLVRLLGEHLEDWGAKVGAGGGGGGLPRAAAQSHSLTHTY